MHSKKENIVKCRKKTEKNHINNPLEVPSRPLFLSFSDGTFDHSGSSSWSDHELVNHFFEIRSSLLSHLWFCLDFEHPKCPKVKKKTFLEASISQLATALVMSMSSHDGARVAQSDGLVLIWWLLGAPTKMLG